jgi:hypothetical protein
MNSPSPLVLIINGVVTPTKLETPRVVRSRTTLYRRAMDIGPRNETQLSTSNDYFHHRCQWNDGIGSADSEFRLRGICPSRDCLGTGNQDGQRSNYRDQSENMNSYHPLQKYTSIYTLHSPPKLQPNSPALIPQPPPPHHPLPPLPPNTTTVTT